MPFWDQHKQIVVVAAAFVTLTGLTWLIFNRRYAAEAAVQREAFAKKFAKEADAKCPPNQGQSVSLLLTQYALANGKIDAAIDALGERLQFKFKDPLIPPAELADRQIFVRKQFTNLKDDIYRKLSSRNIRLAPAATELGLVMPTNFVNETLERDLLLLRQMAVIRHIFGILEMVHDNPSARYGVAVDPVLQILGVAPGAPVATGLDTDLFMQEYPVALEMHITLEGLMNLLRLCSLPETFHIVRDLKIQSLPTARESKPLHKDNRETNNRVTWHGHYFRVKLVLSVLAMMEKKDLTEVIEAATEVKPQPKEYKVRPH